MSDAVDSRPPTGPDHADHTDGALDVDPRRGLPRTDTVLADPRVLEACQRLGRRIVREAVRAALVAARSGRLPAAQVIDASLAALPERAASLRPVVNATGIIIHTNLGRAPLSHAALDAVVAASGTTDVEFDLRTGLRASRGGGALEALAAAVPSAGAVHVVNNNAAALLLLALVLARGREIVISRGELVEIGDGFRIPDLVASSGAALREVGTTNRTHLRDYTAAIGDTTAFVLKVHPSNFTVSGFTSSVGIAQLTGLGVPVVVDIGSGLLRRMPLLPDEPDAESALRAGASLVTASGDKLLGGPQCGLLLGDAALVDRARRHPAARAMRVDKLTLAALEATLRGPEPPVLEHLTVDVAVLRQRASAVVGRLRDAGVEADVVPSFAAVGGGGAPAVTLDSVAVAISPELATALRTGRPPVVGRVEQGRCLLDLRTVDPVDDMTVEHAVLRAVTSPHLT